MLYLGTQTIKKVTWRWDGGPKYPKIFVHKKINIKKTCIWSSSKKCSITGLKNSGKGNVHGNKKIMRFKNSPFLVPIACPLCYSGAMFEGSNWSWLPTTTITRRHVFPVLFLRLIVCCLFVFSCSNFSFQLLLILGHAATIHWPLGIVLWIICSQFGPRPEKWKYDFL